jgi:glycosyltransferase involved in cell wall biosynthesis
VRQLEAWAREGAVEWWGGRSDMPTTLAEANIVCLPTLYREGVPRVLIEAAACARPLVASDLPGCREICRTGANGTLVPPGSAEALAVAVEALLADPAQCARYGRAGRRIAVDEYREELVIDRTLALYRELLEGCP